jgi:hypothetical protein
VELGVYRRRAVNVEVNGALTAAITYEMNNEICRFAPSSCYLDLILDGLREHDYNESIIKKVQGIAALVT